jgi:putative flippase GtrA
MREFGANRLIGEAVAMLFSLQLTFALHDRWTYKGEDFAAGYSMGVRKRYVSYLISNSFGSVLTVVLFASFAFLPRFMALGAAAAVSMVWNFVFNKVVIWRKSNAVALSQAE